MATNEEEFEMPDEATHDQLMRQKVQETTKSVQEVIQELLDDYRQQGTLPLPS